MTEAGSTPLLKEPETLLTEFPRKDHDRSIKTMRAKTCLAALLSSMAISALASGAAAQQVTVEANKSVPLRINGKASSVVIGNPNVADVSVHNENLLFITGRTFGSTNLMVFSAEGRQLYAGDVVVTVNTTSLVNITRAGQNSTYDCAPNCRAVTSIGDEEGFFSRTAQQTQQLQEIAKDE